MNKSIIIIGAGPVGIIFALLNKSLNFKTLLLESNSKNQATKDKRALALSNGSKFILEKIDVWNDLCTKLTPINTIHTSQKGTFGRTVMNAEEFEQESLGFIVSYGDLITSLNKRISNSKNIKVSYDSEALAFNEEDNKQTLFYKQKLEKKSVDCDLLVLADGGKSKIKGIDIKKTNKSFDHSALVSSVETDIPHSNVAYERFTSMGPMALLPNLNGKYSLVWTGPKKDIKSLIGLSDSEFLIALQDHFGDRVGNFELCEKRITFPLKQSFISKYPKENIAIIGNSAQVMHPVAGQGLNTGIRDAFILADCIESEDTNLDIKSMINKFNDMRKLETKNIVKLTESLVTIFSNDFVGLNKFRGIALSFLDLIPPLKKRFVKKMSYGK